MTCPPQAERVSSLNKREAINSLATRYYRLLIQRAGGALPPINSERAWQRLAETMLIAAGPLHRPCPPGFKARLFYHRSLEQWFIVYTPEALVRQRCEMICHEIVEYMTHQDYGPVIDRAPRFAFAYDGGDTPCDIRHQISLAVTQMCFGAPRSSRVNHAPVIGNPSIDLLLETGQLMLGIDLSEAACVPPGANMGAQAIRRLRAQYPCRAQASEWPHESGKCRCGCGGN